MNGPQFDDKNDGSQPYIAANKNAAAEKPVAADKPASRNAAGYKKNRRSSGGGKYASLKKDQDGREKFEDYSDSTPPERHVKNLQNKQPVKNNAAEISKNQKQGKPGNQPAAEKQNARGGVNAQHKESGGPNPQHKDGSVNMQLKDGGTIYPKTKENTGRGGTAARGQAQTANKASAAKKFPQERQETRDRDGESHGVRDRNINIGRDQAYRGKTAGGKIKTGFVAEGNVRENAENVIDDKQTNNNKEVQTNPGASGPQGANAPQGVNAPQGANAPHGANAPLGANPKTHGKQGAEGGGRGRHQPPSHVKKIKAEETLDDIKLDISRIEKEIELEILEIQSLKLVL